MWAVQKGVKLFALDFLQQLQPTKDQYRQQHRLVVGNNSAMVKGLGKRFDMVTYSLSQLSRFGEKTSDKTPSLPTKEALKESGEVENNADIIEIVAKEPDRPVEDYTFRTKIWDMVIRIAKARNGPTGDIPVSFYPPLYISM